MKLSDVVKRAWPTRKEHTSLCFLSQCFNILVSEGGNYASIRHAFMKYTNCSMADFEEFCQVLDENTSQGIQLLIPDLKELPLAQG